MEARSGKLGWNTGVGFAILALPLAIVGDNQAESEEGSLGLPQWHPVKPGTYREQQEEIIQEMDRLVAQFERGDNIPASKKWLMVKMRDSLMASKKIREEEISAIRTLVEPTEDGTRQVNDNRKAKQKCKPRCSSHGHNGARNKDNVWK